MAWLVLVISGCFEAVWALALDSSEGFKKPLPTGIFVVAQIISLLGLAFAMGEIPTGTAYAVWAGVGASSTLVAALVGGRESANPVKLVLLVVLVICLVGLKVLS